MPITLDEAQQAADEINQVLAAGEGPQALMKALALRDALRASVGANPELLPNLQKAEQAIAQLEAAGVKPAKAPPSPDAAPSATTSPTQPSTPPVNGMVAGIVVVLLLVVMVGANWYRSHQATARYEEYKKAAEPALTELEKINAATETGINYTRYMEKIGDANFEFRKFLDKYGDLQAASHEVYESQRAIANSIEHYKSALDWWKKKIDASGSGSVYEAHLQEDWSTASSALRSAKSLLAEGK